MAVGAGDEPIVPTSRFNNAAMITLYNLAQIFRVHSCGRGPEQQLARRDSELAAFRGFCCIPTRRCSFWRYHLNGRGSRGGLVYRLYSLLNDPDKANAFARDRADQPLLVTIVADGGPCCIDACGKRRFRYSPSAPDGFEDIVLADDAIAVGDEIFEKVKHLGLDRDERIPTAELAASRVEDKIFKEIEHFCPYRPGAPRLHFQAKYLSGKNQAHRKEISRPA